MAPWTVAALDCRHFSAMLRDEIGGAAVNLTPSPVMMDIYRAVAEVAQRAMEEAEPDEAGYRGQMAGNRNRKVTKRSVMTTQLRCDQRSAIRYVIDDYLRVVDLGIPPRYHYSAASYLHGLLWPAISACGHQGQAGHGVAGQGR